MICCPCSKSNCLYLNPINLNFNPMPIQDTILCGNALAVLKTLDDKSVDCCITSPPYFNLREYGMEGQIGKEKTPEEYVQNLVNVFQEVNRVLKDNVTLWLNLGDSYNNTSGFKRNSPQFFRKGSVGGSANKLSFKHPEIKVKDLIGIPWMVAFALRAKGWYLRSDIIWNKTNTMPASVKDRPTGSHEYIFLMSKNKTYYYDYEAIKEPCVTNSKTVRNRDNEKLNNTPGRSKSGGLKTNNYEKKNKRDVWTIATKPFKGAHFATFPETLIEPCVLAGCPENGIILDCFMGAGTVGVVAKKHNRHYLGIELNPEYIKIAEERIQKVNPI